jgi:conjugative relaxase-like TrwC/TraI family protein
VVEAITKDEAIRGAYRTAIEKAMFEVEENMQVQVGQGKQKRYETTANMVYASFEHDVTRPVAYVSKDGQRFIPDPHLHTHCFVMNATWNEKKTDSLTPKMAIDQALQHYMERKSATTEKHVPAFVAGIIQEVAQVVFGVFLALVGIDAPQQGAELGFEIVSRRTFSLR